VVTRNNQLVDVNLKMRALERELNILETAKSGFVHTIQKAEDGRPVTASDLMPANIASLEATYTELDRSVDTLVRATDEITTCQPLLTSYLGLLGSPNDSEVLKTLVTQVKLASSSCRMDALRMALVGNADSFAPACKPTAAELETALKLHNGVMKPPTTRLLDARSVEEKVWQALDKARSAKSQVIATAESLNRQVQRGLRHTWKGRLIPELAVTRPNPELSWSKVQTHAVLIKADSPYVKDISLSLTSEEKFDYRLESATGRILGYGIGVIYTPLQESTWTAATVPGTSTKVIAETKRETRAGDLAAFLTYRFMEHRPRPRKAQPILEFGVGITSDRPAFFLGTGVEILRAGRIGFGWSPQRVSTLVATQRVNETVVTSNDEIRTEKRFDTGNWYTSFTFALDSLSLFNRP